jgi:hypothetical protein
MGGGLVEAAADEPVDADVDEVGEIAVQTGARPLRQLSVMAIVPFGEVEMVGVGIV